jgi:hypothetical protein
MSRSRVGVYGRVSKLSDDLTAIPFVRGLPGPTPTRRSFRETSDVSGMRRDR